ncbi:hypothetical protein AQUCO_00200482v1 [Aquilegia coerulea]|uniref:Homeobox-leucine zipper protein n=2 Tax=Aquilegia coerulea TaxID=218851 RepID=A0A2G5F3C1_AQUCA|nr:hypothetical protein AQUCO_00200482v1 [Aquilegia coerulea]
MASRKVYSASNVPVLLQNDGISCSNGAFEALLMPNSTSCFNGKRSMVNFEDACRGNTQGMSFYHTRDQEENGDDDLDDCFRQPEKKRRLSVDQVQFLEKSFEVENKLEPERKVQLAKDLGLQPRQVAIWFQNRRARWKTKQLEKDYDALKASYDSLKSNYENLLKEKEQLKAEVSSLTDKQFHKENVSENSETSKPMEPSQPLAQPDSVPETKTSTIICKQEDLSSVNSDVFDSDSPHYADGVHSSFLETGDSSHVFEPDQSDLSQDEEDNLSKNLRHVVYNFPKLEDPVYPDQSADCGNYEFPVEDQALWFWSY